MFSCTRRPSKKVKEKVDFRLQFHATQVPHTSWDKLYVSLVALDSGRVTGRTRKVSVRNGHCQWDPVNETVKLFLDTRTLQYDEKLYKFVLAKGLSRSCVLGEVIFNISDYVGAASPASVTLPLRFCYAGTLLHVTIQCLTPKTTMDKPFNWLNTGSKHGSDGDTEYSAPCQTRSPLQCLYRTFSVGNHSPVASSATGECSRMQPPSPSSPTSSHVTEKVSEEEEPETSKQQQETMRSELEQLKRANEELVKEKLICEDHICIIQELKGELGQEKRTNSTLNAQVQNLREANMELLLTIRELEDTLEDYTKHTRFLAKCKIYNNPCAEGEEGCSESSYAAETMDKNIDRIIHLNRNDSSSDEVDEEQDVPGLRLFVSTFAEDLSNLKLVMEELGRQPGCYTTGNKQLVGDLEALVEGSKVLIAELQKRSNSDINVDSNSHHPEGRIDESEDNSTQLKELEIKVTELTAEKTKLENMLACYIEQKDIQASTCNELHEEPEESSMQLQELEGKVDELKMEKTKLQCMLRSYREQEYARRSKIEQLEAQLMDSGLHQFEDKLQAMELKVSELTMEKENLESMLRPHEDARTKMDQVESLYGVDELKERCMHLENKMLELTVEKANLERLLQEVNGAQPGQDEEKLKECEDYQQEQFYNDASSMEMEQHSVHDEAVCRWKFEQVQKKVTELEMEKTKLEDVLSSMQKECSVRNEAELEQGLESLNKLKDLETKVLELTMEKLELETVLKSYTEVEENRARRMDQLEAQVMEFAQELDTMQESNQQLETFLLATKDEKEKLEDILKDREAPQMVEKLQDEIKRLEEERQAYYLEKCVGQNLIRDLCEQLQRYIPGASDQEHKQDFIFHVKELRSSFFTLMKNVQESEDRVRDVQSMEDRINMNNPKVMATISILDKQFGELLKESDQKLAACNEEIELLCSKVKQLVKEEKTQGFLKHALEENACEIAYLRDELRRLKVECQEIEDEKLELKNRCEQAEMDLEQSKKTVCSLEQKVTSFETKLEAECDRFDGNVLNLLETLQAKVHMLELDMESTCQDSQGRAFIISGKVEDLEMAYEQTVNHQKSEYEQLIQDLKHQNEELELKVSELSKEKEDTHAQCQSQELEKQIVVSRQIGNDELQSEVSTPVQGRTNQLEVIRQETNEKCGRKKWKQHTDQDIENLRSKVASLEKREAVLCEKIVHLEAAKRLLEEEAIKLKECEAAKVELEETIKQLQSQLQNESVLLSVGKSECARLKRENERLKIELSEKQPQEEPKTKVQLLERRIQELLDMVAAKEAEAEGLKQELQEKESYLWKKIECLEMSNEQLAVQQVDSGVDQLKKELTRLQNHNSELIRREHELTSKVSTHELLQHELQRLQEENELLEQKFSKLKEASLWGDTLERLVYLETELAEALETNNMYKMQLQNIFAKRHNMEAGGDTGDVEEIINNLVSFKKQTSYLEAELKEMQERYMKMSMRFAEIQSEREELLMTVKTLRSTNYSKPKV